MRRSRRADTPRDTPGNVYRAAANAALSEDGCSDQSPWTKNQSGPRQNSFTSGFTHETHHDYCMNPRIFTHRSDLSERGEDTLLTRRKVGRSVMDDEAGSVSSEITDACSEITDVSLETSASGACAGVGAGMSHAKHSKEDEEFLMSMHWCSPRERYCFQDLVASALEVGAERTGGTAKWVHQFEQEVWPAERARQLLGKKGEELELARLLYWWEALSSQTIDPCTDCGLRLCKCPASASCDCVCSSLCSCSREETGARERLWGAFLEANDCVYAIYEFSDARWATYRIEDRDSAGTKGGSKRRLVSPGQAMEEAATTAAEAARAAAMWQRAVSALEREVRREMRQRARQEVALERERNAGMVLAVEDLLRETWEEVLDEVVVGVWLDWEGVQRRERRMRGALGRRARGKRDVGMGRRRRRRRRRERLRAEQREREQLEREVQQRLDFVRWEERQEGKWEAAAAAVVVAAAATAAGVQARWWVRKGRARQRRRRATAAAAATATATAAAAAAAATAGRSGWAEAAPASLCRRAERVLHSQLRHGGWCAVAQAMRYGP